MHSDRNIQPRPQHRQQLIQNGHPGGGFKKTFHNYASTPWFGTAAPEYLSKIKLLMHVGALSQTLVPGGCLRAIQSMFGVWIENFSEVHCMSFDPLCWALVLAI